MRNNRTVQIVIITANIYCELAFEKTMWETHPIRYKRILQSCSYQCDISTVIGKEICQTKWSSEIDHGC